MATVSGTSPPLLCCTNRRAGFSNKPSLRSRPQDPILHAKAVFWGIGLPNAAFTTARNPRKELQIEAAHENDGSERLLQIAAWLAEGVYILWPFLLPYAPGDPVWGISLDTVNSLVSL
ncbi:hypothetical protein TB2_020355 [Malus domestica]